MEGGGDGYRVYSAYMMVCSAGVYSVRVQCVRWCVAITSS
jgi:hypothetical protein